MALTGAAVLDPGADTSAGAARTTRVHRLSPDTRDPDFVDGMAVGVDGRWLTVIRTPPPATWGTRGKRHGAAPRAADVEVTGATRIWMLRHGVSLEQVSWGDVVYARGRRLADGTLLAHAMWVNIVNLHVVISGAGPGHLWLDYPGGRLRGRVVAGTTVVVDRLARASDDTARVRVGRHAQVVGAWRAGTGDLDIATVFI